MILALDIETTGLDNFRDEILCIGVFAKEIGYRYFESLEAFRSFNEPFYRYVCHNGSFDISFLRRKGLDLREQFAWDTKSLATVLAPAPPIAPGQRHAYSLENLYLTLLSGAKNYKLNRADMTSYSKEEVRAYNEKDCRITHELFYYLISALDDASWKFAKEWAMPTTKLLMEMAYNGVKVDREGLMALKTQTEGELHETQADIEKDTEEPRKLFHERERQRLALLYRTQCVAQIAKGRNPLFTEARYAKLEAAAVEKIEPFNFASSKQLTWLLKDFYGLNLFNERSKKETTDEAQLKQLANEAPLCRKLLKFRELQKMASTCIPALLDHCAPDGRVHPSFNIGGTRTGRISSSSPNFQQVPRGKLRECVIPAEGHSFYIADYAQIEVRILAELAGEEELIHGFKKGIDCYSIIAQKLLKLPGEVADIKSRFPRERNASKTAGLSILYGTGAAQLREMLAKELGVTFSIGECRDFIRAYREGFPAIKAFKAGLEEALKDGKKIYGLLGRPIVIPDNDDIYMKGLNTLVQGSASDLVLHAFNKITRKLCQHVRPVLVVHDEMVMEIRDEEATPELLKEIEAIATTEIEAEFKLTVPLKIEAHVAKAWEKP